MDYSSQEMGDLGVVEEQEVEEVHQEQQLQQVASSLQQPMAATQRSAVGAIPVRSVQQQQQPQSGRLRIDSDDDNEEDEDEYMDMAAIRSLKEGLTDPAQKKMRNRELLDQMLALDEPSLTAKMFDFLVQDDVAETLIDVVAQPSSEESAVRPVRAGVVTEALKKSYKVTMLLTADEPTDALLSFVSQTAGRMTKRLLKAFDDDSTASFYHACRILEFLLRYHPKEVYETVNNMEGGPPAVVGKMIRHIGYSPVGDTIVKLVALTTVPRLSHLYSASAKFKWTFYEHLAEWRFLVQLAQAISSAESVCYIPDKSMDSEDDVIVADTHAAAATMVFQDLLEKLTSDDSAEILLQPVGHAPELIDELVGCGINAEMTNERRRYALQVLNFLLKRTADPQIVIFSGGLGMAMAPKFLANRLHPLREPFLAHLNKKFLDLCRALLAYGQISKQAQEAESIRHPGGYTSVPFSSSRLALVELTVLLVEATPRLATLVSVELWRELLNWCFRYPHNNIYHSLYYRLLFQVLRENHKGTLQAVVQKCKLVNKLVEAYQQNETTGVGSNDVLNKGFILRCCNAIRLQAQSLAPASFLRTYLKAHDVWREFLPQLRELTTNQTTPGMGIPVPPSSPNYGVGSGIMLPAMGDTPSEHGIDHGSQFARSLGFEDDVDWPEDEEHSKKKRKKNKKKKGKGKNKNRESFQSSDRSMDGDDDDGEEEEEEEEEDGDDTDDLSVGRESVDTSDCKEEDEASHQTEQPEASLNELD